MNRVAAFFDFDQTLITTHTAYLVGKYLRENNIKVFCGKRLSLFYFLKLITVKQLSATPLVSAGKLEEVLFEFYKGRRRDLVLEWAAEFYEDYIKGHLAPVLLNKINEHRNKGHYLVIVSGGVRDILQVVADNMKFDDLLCSDLEVDGRGYYTGKPLGVSCIGMNKQLNAKNLAKKMNIDMKNSFSYGNQHDDIPILEIVGNPFAVEPTQELLQVAKIKGWPILSYH